METFVQPKITGYRQPWSIDAWQGRVAIRHEDMPEDAALEFAGDFGSEEAKLNAAEHVRFILNAEHAKLHSQLHTASTKTLAAFCPTCGGSA